MMLGSAGLLACHERWERENKRARTQAGVKAKAWSAPLARLAGETPALPGNTFS